MATNKKLKITDLLVNPDNYRFESVGSQKEAINKMIDDQRDHLYVLAESIISKGLNPMDRLMVTGSSHYKTKYIVIEGNRRTVAIKLLHNPDLIEGNEFIQLKKKFKKLATQNPEKIPTEVDCVFYEDARDTEHWVGLKHGYGDVGAITNTWGTLQKERFSELTEGKLSTSLQIIKLLKENDKVPQTVKAGIDKIKVTNLNRLVSDPAVRKFLGIDISNGTIHSNTKLDEVVKGLTHIVKDILKPGFNVNTIYTKDDRKDYLDSIPDKARPDLTLLSDHPWNLNSAAPTPAKAEKSIKPVGEPKERNTLIPKNCHINIQNPKVLAIYHELLKLDINKFTNACAVLFRVFVELSIDCYIESNSLTSSPSSTRSGMDFHQKTNQAVDSLTKNKHIDAAISKTLKVGIKSPNDILGIDTWHAYVHNSRFSPKAKDLIITWDGMQDFMVTLWNNVINS